MLWRGKSVNKDKKMPFGVIIKSVKQTLTSLVSSRAKNYKEACNKMLIFKIWVKKGKSGLKIFVQVNQIYGLELDICVKVNF